MAEISTRGIHTETSMKGAKAEGTMTTTINQSMVIGKLISTKRTTKGTRDGVKGANQGIQSQDHKPIGTITTETCQDLR